MHNFEMRRFVNRPNPSGHMVALGLPVFDTQLAQEYDKNTQFVGMLNAFRNSGGLARAQEVSSRFKSRSASEVSPLAGWIAKRQVISLEWQSKIWLPLFQFVPGALALRAGLSAVLAELVPAHDDWGVATWFTLPNAWLANATPADTLAAEAPKVLNAAFAERFVVAA